MMQAAGCSWREAAFGQRSGGTKEREVGSAVLVVIGGVGTRKKIVTGKGRKNLLPRRTAVAASRAAEPPSPQTGLHRTAPVCNHRTQRRFWRRCRNVGQLIRQNSTSPIAWSRTTSILTWKHDPGHRSEFQSIEHLVML